jgi:ABC-type transport system involved in cytochrome bd biosynthesis fused ATPase/permease subunit
MTAVVRLLTLLGAYRWRVALAIVLGCATIASNIGLLATAAYLIAAAALKPLLVTLAFPIYLVRLFGVSRAFSRYAERLVSHNVTLTLLAEVRTWFYSRLEPLAPARLLEYRSGDVLARITKDVDELENLFQRVFAPTIVALMTSLLTCGLLYIVRPALAFAAAGFLLAAGLGVPLLLRALMRGLGKRHVALRAELNARTVDGIQGMQDLLACGNASRRQHNISALTRAIASVEKRIALISGLQRALHDLAMNLAVWATLLLAVPLVTHRAVAGIYLAFLVVVVMGSFEAVQPLGQAFQFLGRTVAAGERLFEIVDATPRVRDEDACLACDCGRDEACDCGRMANHGHCGAQACDCVGPPLAGRANDGHGGAMTCATAAAGVCDARLHVSGSRWKTTETAAPSSRPQSAGFAMRPQSQALQVDRVSFAYRAEDGLVLDQISLDVAAGSWVAVVGPSGSGKSTLAHLILRFWDPTSGEIRIGGHNIRDYALDDLRSMVGVVAQDTHIFADTLRHNLLLARPDAGKGEIAQALERAQLAELVEGLPRGLDTWVGEQGLRLSGGERQRLAIARTLLKNAPILLLDETTANLDPITEQALLAAIHELMRGRTVLTISHRLIGMERMAEIVVLDHGRIVERGTHDHLVAAQGLYRQMLDVQNQMLNLADERDQPIGAEA